MSQSPRNNELLDILAEQLAAQIWAEQGYEAEVIARIIWHLDMPPKELFRIFARLRDFDLGKE